jgi:response regulator RpfG family c-di-GMP phosphodiesterase
MISSQSQTKQEDLLYERSPKILIVEDDSLQRESLLEMVKEDFLDPVAVGTAAEALALCVETEFDLCIVDGKLPDDSGTHLIGEIRILHPSTPCILLTGFPDHFSADLAVNCGAEGFVVKPVNSHFLLSLIEGILFRRLLLQERERFEGVVQTVRAFRHEIGNPLQGLLGSVELLLRHVPSDPSLDRYMRNIQISIDQIVNLMNRLNQIKRMTSRDSPAGPMLDLSSADPAPESRPRHRDNENPREN